MTLLARREDDELRPRRVLEARSLVEALKNAAISQRGAETGLRFLDRREKASLMSWRDLKSRATEVGRRLAALGIARGDRVALVYPTGDEFFQAFFGVLMVGATPVPLYPPVRLGRLGEYHERSAGMLRRCQARLVLADRRVRRLLGETILRATPELGCVTLSELPRGSTAAGPHLGILELDPEELALIQFSSGTTSEPRAVALSHRAVLFQAQILGDHFPDRRDHLHSGVSWLPLYHDMGLIGCVFTALCRPADLTLLPPEVFLARPALWLRAISKYHGTVSPAPNFAYALCVDRVRDQEMDGVDLSSWRVALNGAETVTPEVIDAFCDRFARWGFRREAMTPVYGLAEAALAVSFSSLERPARRARFSCKGLSEGVARSPEPGESSIELISVGRPLPGFRCEIRSENGDPQPDDQIGRLWTIGPSLMSGYSSPAGIAPRDDVQGLVDGWLDTGDEAFLHEGELYISGRARDVVILRGRNHSPEWFEQALLGIEGLRAGCNIAVSHRLEGSPSEELLVFAERARGVKEGRDEQLAEAIRQALVERTSIRPARIEILAPGTLPRTSSGKLRRRYALELWLDGKLEEPHKAGVLPLLKATLESRAALKRAREQPGPESSDRNSRPNPTGGEER